MRAAVVEELGRTPSIRELDDPSREEGQALVEVTAASLNPVDLAIAAGRFYAFVPPVPSVPGREGVGRVIEADGLAEGTPVYFDSPVSPYGSFAERTLIAEGSAIELPAGIDDALAASLGIAGLAAWLALEWRAGLREGETVLVLGASGAVGQLAVQAARLLGAGRVVAAARSPEGLTRAGELGAEEAVRIGEADDLAEAFRIAGGGGVDVIVDPLWGEPAEAAVAAANHGARLVQVGRSAGERATLESRDVRGKMLAILGHANASAPPEVRRAAYRRMLDHALAGELTVDLETLPLDEVAQAWRRQAESPNRKLVLVP